MNQSCACDIKLNFLRLPKSDVQPIDELDFFYSSHNSEQMSIILEKCHSSREVAIRDDVCLLAKAMESFISLRRPLAGEAVAAGFPSPADDYVETALDLHQHLIAHPAATFYVRVSGDSMTGAGIFAGDILVVDRSREPLDRAIVIAVVNGELTVKRMRRLGDGVELQAEHPGYRPLRLEGDMDAQIWGVVSGVVRKY
jgi:DNA polymerase V